MKIICRIAKTELQMLFYSPIAWLLLLCFVIQTSIIFSNLLEPLVRTMDEGGHAWRVSRALFADSRSGLWIQVQNFLYFYIPMLTMGTVSKDFSGGSIKLLYSSPISSAQIILGKFLSMVFYALILTAVLLIYIIIALCCVDNFEIGWVLCGLLGLFLLMCTYMAVGIFMSSLTSYQVIAAVGTFIVFMLLNIVGGWGQQYDFVREITYWLDISGRASTFMSGMLCSEDLLYFPVIIAFFIALTIIRLNAVRQKQRFAITVGKNMVLVVIVCAVAFVSSRPSLLGYYDSTLTKLNTLTPVSQEIIKQVDGGLTITSYINALDPSYSSAQYPYFIMQNRNYFKQYTRFKPETRLKNVYYYAEPDSLFRVNDPMGEKAWQKVRTTCEYYDLDSMMLKTQAEIDQMADFSEEGYRFVREIVRENGQRTWLREYDYGGDAGEAEISVALKRMVMDMPKLGYVTDNRVRGMRDLSPRGLDFLAANRRVRFSVWNQGFDVEEITLNEPVPDSIIMLLIADPRDPFTPEQEANLKTYLDRGGNLVMCGEPRHRDAQNPIFKRLFGMVLSPMIVQSDSVHKQLLPNVINGFPTKEGEEKMYQLEGVWTFVMPTAGGLEQVEDRGYEVFPLITVDTSRTLAWTELETTDFIDDTIKFNPMIGEVCKKFTLAWGLSKKIGDKEQRIVLIGDTDVISNDAYLTNYGAGGTSHAILLGSSTWMTDNQVPVDIRRPKTMDNDVKMSMSAFFVVSWFLRGFIPLLVLGLYVYLWLRRRGR